MLSSSISHPARLHIISSSAMTVFGQTVNQCYIIVYVTVDKVESDKQSTYIVQLRYGSMVTLTCIHVIPRYSQVRTI